MYIDNSRAAYRILSPAGFYGPDDTLYTVDAKGDPAVIYFDGEPNEEMEPLNDIARDRVKVYLEKLDNLAREVAIKTGKPYVERPKSLDGGLAMASAVQKSEMGIMGRAHDNSQIQKVDVQIEETGNTNPNKRGRGRPAKGTLAIAS